MKIFRRFKIDIFESGTKFYIHGNKDELVVKDLLILIRIILGYVENQMNRPHDARTMLDELCLCLSDRSSSMWSESVSKLGKLSSLSSENGGDLS